MSTRYRVLDGLPPYGPPAEPFSATGQGMHREGLVIEFFGAHGERWTGNFQRGSTSLDKVVEGRTGPNLLVVAGGQAFEVDPDERQCLRMFGGQIEDVLELPDRIVFSNGLWFEATGGEHLLWRTRRISWDGFRNLRIEGMLVLGEAYDPMTDGWVSFSVETQSGATVGGSYPVELPQ